MEILKFEVNSLIRLSFFWPPPLPLRARRRDEEVKGAALDACSDSVIGEKVLRRRQFTERVRVERGRIVRRKDSGITERCIAAAREFG